MSNPLKIKVYKGKGVDRRVFGSLLQEMSAAEISFLTAEELLENEWERTTDILLIPGGRDIPYHLALKGKGNRKIRAFVEQGGAFLGICAGAYFGCQAVCFAEGSPIEVVEARELAFFPGKACGPLFGPLSFVYNSEAGAQALLMSNEEKPAEPFYAYYNGGCYFEGAESLADVNILSRYVEIEKSPAAIIEVRVGKGVAILSGAHLEIGGEAPPPHVELQVLQQIQESNSARKNFLAALLKKLGADRTKKLEKTRD